nr:nucleotide-binding protein [Bartonella tribocorum]
MLRRLELEPYILKDTSGNGLTIIEILEKETCNDSTGFGIVLLTLDDIGYAISDGETKAQFRARQNVVLEMGMLIATLSRKNVAILRKEGIEIPSDAHGIKYIAFKEHVKEALPDLFDRLCEAGYNVDAKKLTKASR